MKHIEDRLARIEGKTDQVAEKISSIDVTLAKQHESLKEHIRRTGILEAKLEPVEKHVAMVHGALKLIGLLALMGGIVEGIVAALEFLGHK